MRGGVGREHPGAAGVRGHRLSLASSKDSPVSPPAANEAVESCPAGRPGRRTAHSGLSGATWGSLAIAVRAIPAFLAAASRRRSSFERLMSYPQ